MKIAAPEYWLHPEGTFPAQLVDVEEAEGKYGPRIKWVWETDVEREDGKAPQLAYYTGTSASEKSNLGQMLLGCGIALPTGAEELDTDDLMGTECRIKVTHDEASDGRMWANIEKFLKAKAAATAHPAPKPKPTAKAPEPEEGSEDIFKDEDEE